MNLFRVDTIKILIQIQTNYIIVKPSWCQLYNFSCIYNKIINNKKPSAHILIYTNIYNKKKIFLWLQLNGPIRSIEYKISISDFFFIIYCGFYFWSTHAVFFSSFKPLIKTPLNWVILKNNIEVRKLEFYKQFLLVIGFYTLKQFILQIFLNWRGRCFYW